MASDKSLPFVKFLLDPKNNTENNLIAIITAYQKKHKSSSRETTSTFLLNLSKETWNQVIPHQVNLLIPKNFLLAIKFVLESQLKGLEENLKEYGTPSFLRNLLDVLNSNLAKHKGKTSPLLLSKEANDEILAAEIKKLLPLITYDLMLLNGEFQSLATIDGLQNLLRGLFNYCVSKESEESSKLNFGIGVHPEKRTAVYDVIAKFFTAETSKDVLKIFQLIQAGITASRKSGTNKAKSREAEFALAPFSDALLEMVFKSDSPIKIKDEDLYQILETISYKGYVSKHTLKVIEAIEKSEQNKINIDLRMKHISYLVLDLPNKVNDEEIDKARECFNRGTEWAKAITDLLANSRLKGEKRTLIILYGYVWNKYMRKVNAQKEYYVEDKEFDITSIYQNALFPKEFKEEAEEEVKQKKALQYSQRELPQTLTPLSSSARLSSASSTQITRKISVPPKPMEAAPAPSQPSLDWSVIIPLAKKLYAFDKDKHSLKYELKLYKNDNDGTIGNKRKESSDFLDNLMEKLLDLEAAQKLINGHSYNFLLVISLLLKAQKELLSNVNTSGKAKTSKFIPCILDSLEFNLTIIPSAQSSIDSRIEIILNKLNETLKGFDPTFIFCNPKLQEAFGGLFLYSAKKELEFGSHEDKRQAVNDIIQTAVIAHSPDEITKLFEAITAAIQLSRKQGISGTSSNESEEALLIFRDELLNTIFKTTPPHFDFNADQLINILKSLEINLNKHAITIINLINSKLGVTTGRKNDLIVEYLSKLVLEIPGKINGEKTNKALYCFEKGPEWAKAFNHLLADVTFKDEEVRDKIEACAFVWNMYIEKLRNKGEKIGKEYDVDPLYLNIEKIKDNKDISEKYRKKAKEIAEILKFQSQSIEKKEEVEKLEVTSSPSIPSGQSVRPLPTIPPKPEQEETLPPSTAPVPPPRSVVAGGVATPFTIFGASASAARAQLRPTKPAHDASQANNNGGPPSSPPPPSY
jgi:hypothetical protein